MKITKKKLMTIIEEEVIKILNEQSGGGYPQPDIRKSDSPEEAEEELRRYDSAYAARERALDTDFGNLYGNMSDADLDRLTRDIDQLSPEKMYSDANQVAAAEEVLRKMLTSDERGNFIDNKFKNKGEGPTVAQANFAKRYAQIEALTKKKVAPFMKQLNRLIAAGEKQKSPRRQRLQYKILQIYGQAEKQLEKARQAREREDADRNFDVGAYNP